MLDWLRGFAIILVIGRHYAVPAEEAGSLADLVTFWARIGWTGVNLFFVLSGFLIANLLFENERKTGRIDAKIFWIRRAFKIFPSYFAYLFLIYLVQQLKPGTHSHSDVFFEFLPSMLHVQNYFGSPRVHLWSLAVEEHFYLALPVVLLFFSNAPSLKRFFVPSLLLTIVFITAARYMLSMEAPRSTFYETHLCAEGLLMGVLIAHAHREGVTRIAAKWRAPLVALGLMLVSPMFVVGLETGPWIASVGLTLVNLGYACIVLVALQDWNVGTFGFRNPVFRAVAVLGTYSFTAYLWHMDIGHRIASVVWNLSALDVLPIETKWFVSTATYFVTTLIAAIVMSRLVEMPSLALRDRWFPRTSSAREVDAHSGIRTPTSSVAD